MSTAHEGHAGAIADREISNSRVFNLPRDLVFKAWTDPDQATEQNFDRLEAELARMR
jgi:uncharacterized protein YndB with AHSA1/START domain